MNVNSTKRSREETGNEQFVHVQKRQRKVENTASFAQTHLGSNVTRPPIKINFPPNSPSFSYLNRTPIKINFPPNSASSNAFTSLPTISPNNLEALQTLCFQMDQDQKQPSDVNDLQAFCFQIEQALEDK